MRFLAFYAFLVLPLAVNAGLNDYQCIVTGEAFLRENGTIGPKDYSVYVKQRFAIDRATGMVTGGPFWTVRPSGHEVLDPGDSEWSYKALARAATNPDGHRFVDYVVVNEHEKVAKKPFVALVGGSTVVHGVCE